MTKHDIRHPRKPKGEDPKTTIANQDRQIKLLIDRCQSLQMMVDSLERAANERRENMALERDIFDKTAEELNAKTLAYIRLQGFQDCAREIIEKFVEISNVKYLPPFPSPAPGV